MTILDASNKLFEHFSKKDSFNMDEDYTNIMQISETPDEDKIAFILALEDMEKSEFIKSHQSGKKKTYILKKPFTAYEQNLIIAGLTCNLIAKVINEFCDKIKDKRDYCDAKNITEKDIRNLMFLASMADTSQQNQEKIL